MEQAQNTKKMAERLVIGLSGASGVAYGIRLLEALKELGIESHLVMTKPAEMTIGYETNTHAQTGRGQGRPPLCDRRYRRAHRQRQFQDQRA